MSIPQSSGGPIESFDQLAGYLESGNKTKENWRVGTEHEKFGFCKQTLQPLPYQGERSIRSVLLGLKDRFGWEPLEESGYLIGLTKGGANISLEPGGALELAGVPLETIHETCNEVNTHLKEVREIADKIGVGFIGLGAAPIWTHENVELMPKGRYQLMDAYMDKVGSMGQTMMRRTCTVQVNLDFKSEKDMVKKFRVALALQPVATALFANSPFFEGKVIGHKSWRSRIWRDLDADRTGMLPFVFEDGMGFQRYVDYALDVPMYFVYRNGKYINALGQSFRDFLKGRLPALPGEVPTVSDWADHLTTIFPEVRIKKIMEMRGADGGPWRSLCALPAFWVGLLYDQNSLDAAWDLVKEMDTATRESLRVAASVDGLAAEVNGVKMIGLARQAVKVSKAGLKARARSSVNGLAQDETQFLDPLIDILETEMTPADTLLARFNGDWHGNLNKIYEDYSY
tara:strand:- start:3508 stop:4878 length:1371 start_codon:yes stop_codon:yes gene_type:complete